MRPYRLRSRWTNAALLAAVIGLTATASARAQTHQVAQRVGSGAPTLISAVVEDVNTRQALYSVRADLRQLLVAQEGFWRARRSYAPDITFLPSFHPTPGVAIQIVRARADGWAARASYGDAVGTARSCVIWVGDVPPAERPATDSERKIYPEAEVSCDGDGYNAVGEWEAAGRSYMTYALRKLVQSEARFYAFHRRYTADTAALDPFIWDRDVSVAITTATPLGWAARATFANAPGKSCVTWHGTLDSAALPMTRAEHARTDADRVACDR